MIAIEDRDRLESFLTQWTVFDELFNDEYSYKLLIFWRQVGYLSRNRILLMGEFGPNRKSKQDLTIFLCGTEFFVALSRCYAVSVHTCMGANQSGSIPGTS